ncbi:MAG: ATP-binding cassette domain-containing protein [Rhodothermales bacterium]
MRSALLDIANATVFRGRNKVFDGLSLRIEAGVNVAILGPNGAGKSTLLKLLCREIHAVYAEDSHVRVLGKERWNVWELRSQIGVVSHDLQLDYVGHAKGDDIVLSGFYASIDTWPHQTFSPEQRERARRVIEDLGIAHLADRTYARMSTGEQRRFLLARALVNDPQTLILDEPTSGLDLNACFQYLHTIRSLMQAGKTVILVTHHLHEIPPEIEQIVLIKAGAVFDAGAKTDLLTDGVLSALYETPVTLLQANGYYQAVPGGA